MTTASSNAKRMCGGPVVCLEDEEDTFCGVHVAMRKLVVGTKQKVVTGNTFLSTSSPQFALFYVLCVLPSFGKEIPPQVSKYLSKHEATMKEYFSTGLISPSTTKIWKTAMPWLDLDSQVLDISDEDE